MLSDLAEIDFGDLKARPGKEKRFLFSFGLNVPLFRCIFIMDNAFRGLPEQSFE